MISSSPLPLAGEVDARSATGEGFTHGTPSVVPHLPIALTRNGPLPLPLAGEENQEAP